MLITDDDIIAIHRANATGGTDAAMVELRRRWLALTDATAPKVLGRVLAMRVAMPMPPDAKATGPRHDGPVVGKAPRRR